ncbi:TPA: hypothetical protein ACT9K3_002308 [Legionella pneumophila]|nr:hypothetical protein [Legionella pneumophila]
MPYYLLTKIFDELFKFFRELSLREVIASFLYLSPRVLVLPKSRTILAFSLSRKDQALMIAKMIKEYI